MLEYDVKKLYERYRTLQRHSNRKHDMNWCRQTMPLWPKGVERKMEKKIQSGVLPQADKSNLVTDLNFLRNMKSERTATHGRKDLKKCYKNKEKVGKGRSKKNTRRKVECRKIFIAEL